MSMSQSETFEWMRSELERLRTELQTERVAHERTREDREFLWKLLDDIDTAADMAKSDDIAYRRLVDKIQQRRHEVGHSPDGHKLVWERKR